MRPLLIGWLAAAVALASSSGCSIVVHGQAKSAVVGNDASYVVRGLDTTVIVDRPLPASDLGVILVMKSQISQCCYAEAFWFRPLTGSARLSEGEQAAKIWIKYRGMIQKWPRDIRFFIIKSTHQVHFDTVYSYAYQRSDKGDWTRANASTVDDLIRLGV
jgi:hypothetical protein